MVLKTRTPLKRTPLKRTSQLSGNGDGLVRTPLKRHKCTIRHKSPKQIAKDREWKESSFIKHMENDGICEAYHIIPGCSVMVPRGTPAHHKLKRRHNDHSVKNAMTVCQNCHDYIEANPLWSKEMGYWI